MRSHRYIVAMPRERDLIAYVVNEPNGARMCSRMLSAPCAFSNVTIILSTDGSVLPEGSYLPVVAHCKTRNTASENLV